MSPSSAGRQRRSLPRSGSPLWGAFLFGNVPECSDASDGTWGGRARKNADRRSFWSEPLERAFAAVPGTTAAGLRRSPGKRQACVAAGDASRCPAFCHPGGGRSGASPVGLSATGMGQGRRTLFLPALPYVRNRTAAAERRLRRRGKKRLVAVGTCHLRAFGLWKLVHRSTLRQRPGVPGNALRRIFRCLPVMGPGRRQAGLQGLGRCGRSQPFWRIEKWLTSA